MNVKNQANFYHYDQTGFEFIKFINCSDKLNNGQILDICSFYPNEAKKNTKNVLKKELVAISYIENDQDTEQTENSLANLTKIKVFTLLGLVCDARLQKVKTSSKSKKRKKGKQKNKKSKENYSYGNGTSLNQLKMNFSLQEIGYVILRPFSINSMSVTSFEEMHPDPQVTSILPTKLQFGSCGRILYGAEVLGGQAFLIKLDDTVAKVNTITKENHLKFEKWAYLKQLVDFKNLNIIVAKEPLALVKESDELEESKMLKDEWDFQIIPSDIQSNASSVANTKMQMGNVVSLYLNDSKGNIAKIPVNELANLG